MNVQAICDSRRLFMDPESSINSKFQNGTLPVTYQSLILESTKVGSYFIGDPNYLLTPYTYCMKELETCNLNAQAFFCKESRRVYVENIAIKIDLKLVLVPAAVYALFYTIFVNNMCITLILNWYKTENIYRNTNSTERGENIPDTVFAGNVDEC